MRPLPQPSELTRPFWDGAVAHRLLHPRCDACGGAFFPPHAVCPACRAAAWSWQESAGRGTVHSSTVVHRAPQEGFATPYVLAVVDLDEGFELMTNVVGAGALDVTTGRRVRVAWQQVGDSVLPVFEADPEQEDASA
ncbi:Zn-ribbon domain-containing OB-fold protein [Nocardioides hwasunensis]|uniref:Zn-ribbon domain-containing OB-fold protein n=1 Tax=Nocardioides hwasunensis TaxID=397258 RepID=A0ABR8MSB8_9ACTN|nr:Zn-ribbon domain-containing OB-fold protein [Nocardioides hwasunensis]MBD3917044.1 Zn-ribbon domain-containing OB-fold protein [Nocardioides hwasunensis]